ncbi:hypothetical protein AXG93_2175s1890 [Marchantia polymorpha subsp. ruderalis]|uniref:F-box domain-containing protein n=1 Tax=Marchantia polymorpha subsp. ruderalis TaxID=1480154 RepID=A0A176W874_MARPO|nr:hypothetical protein AXG93_2175s1890 [Marchantia polymorpha subsp. ruderalis]
MRMSSREKEKKVLKRSHRRAIPPQKASTSSLMKEEYESESGEEQSLTYLLPDDALIHVLRSLPTRELLCSAAFVCKRWHRLCRQHMNEAQLFQLAVSHSSSLERLSLVGLKRLTGSDVISLLPKLPKLEDLSIESCTNFGSDDLEAVCSQLPSHLLSLDLHNFDSVATRYHNCSIPRKHIDDNVVGAIHQRCPKLQKLNLDYCGNLSMKAVGLLLQGCQFLTSLDLHSYKLGWPEVAEIFRLCQSLRHFSLVSIRLDLLENPGKELSDFLLPGPVPVPCVLPRQLTSLRLYRSPNRAISMESGPMRIVLEEFGTQLLHLHAQTVYNTTWEVIRRFCPNLKLLDLSHCKVELCLATKIEETMLCGMFPTLKDLEYLALPYATDAILLKIGWNCPKLRELRFQGFGIVDKPTVFKEVTDAGVVGLVEGCPDLRVLSLAGCRNITALSTRRLNVLILNRCTGINDNAVAVMMPRLCSSLVYLDLIGCKLTRLSWQSILKHAKDTTLRVLALNGRICPPGFEKTLGPRVRVIEGCSSGLRWLGYYHELKMY